MVFLHALLHGFAIAAAVVASLRAGSRAAYISRHGAIGLVDGPVVSASGGNPALYELAENFRHCVEVSLGAARTSGAVGEGRPFRYENVATDRPVTIETASGGVPSARARQKEQTTQGLVGRLFSVLEQEQKKRQLEDRIQKRKDPFGGPGRKGSRGYSLGYAPYEPKTFSATPSDEMATGRSSPATESEDDDDDDEPDEAPPPILPFASKVVTRTDRIRAKSDALLSSVSGSVSSSRRKLLGWLPVSGEETTGFDPAEYRRSFRGQTWDYGRATEADYFYGVETGEQAKRRRLAQLTAYCPKVFSHLRGSVFGISEESYLRSVASDLVSFQSNSKGAARAGGVFFFTSDGAYLIKTIPNREKNTFLEMLPRYHRHMARYGKSSLLTRFCGMYGITIREEETEVEEAGGATILRSGSPGGEASDDGSPSPFAPTEKEYTFVVMNAVFPAESNKFISERFDLKGSTVGREVSQEELRTKGSMAVLKDLDLKREVDAVEKENQRLLMVEANRRVLVGGVGPLRRLWQRTNAGRQQKIHDKADHAGFTIGATAKAALLSQLRKDVDFLKECRVMDYSLLVGVVHRDDASATTGSGRAAAVELSPDVVQTIRQRDRILERLEGPASSSSSSSFPSGARTAPKLDSWVFHTLTTPVRLLASPPVYVARKSWKILRRTLDSIATAPMPYYGSGHCGVYGGKLSVLHGERKRHRAIYYLGLIDFLQPWSTRKVLERRLKGLAGQDTDAVSAVTPEEYAARFLRFLDEHIH